MRLQLSRFCLERVKTARNGNTDRCFLNFYKQIKKGRVRGSRIQKFGLPFLSLVFVSVFIINTDDLRAEEVKQQVVDRLSPKERHAVNTRKSFCSKIDEIIEEFAAISPDLNSKECAGTTSETYCLFDAVERYQKKLAEYFMILTGANLLGSPVELIRDKATKQLFVELHKNWQEYQKSEFKSIEIFYDGDGTMYPRAIAEKKAILLEAKGYELLDYIRWHCFNS